MEVSCTIWYAHQKITFDDTSVQHSVGRVIKLMNGLEYVVYFWIFKLLFVVIKTYTFIFLTVRL